MSQEGLRFPLGLSRSDRIVKTDWFQLVEKHFFSVFARLVRFVLLCVEEGWPGC